MKKILFLSLAMLITSGLFAQNFTLKSKDLGGQFTNEFLAGNFGCNGSNLSPELYWTGAPSATKSFALTVYDLDAPTGSGFWHWVIIDIPFAVNELKRGAGNPKLKNAPAGSRQCMNDTGGTGYQGPCPGEGEGGHRYIITVYALSVGNLSASSGAPAALMGYLLNKAALAKASLIVYCKR